MDTNENLKWRIFAYEKSHDNIPLAEEYLKFLKESADETDFEIRVISIEMREGRRMKAIKQLFNYLSDASRLQSGQIEKPYRIWNKKP